MWRTLTALVLFVTPALAQERLTAYDALRVVGVHLNREAVNHVISVTGVRGNPQPETWRVLIADQRGNGGVREIQVRKGRSDLDRDVAREVRAPGWHDLYRRQSRKREPHRRNVCRDEHERRGDRARSR